MPSDPPKARFSLESLIAATPSPPELVLLDPPWLYQKNTLPIDSAARFTCMPTKEIALYFPPVAETCAMFMWATASFLPDAFWLIKQWGFHYSTMAWVWVKVSKKSGKPVGSLGAWNSQVAEYCLLATKGKCWPPAKKMQLALIMAPRTKPLASKPQKQYEIIDGIFPNRYPRLEMYARQAWPGWCAWGNELQKGDTDE